MDCVESMESETISRVKDGDRGHPDPDNPPHPTYADQASQEQDQPKEHKIMRRNSLLVFIEKNFEVEVRLDVDFVAKVMLAVGVKPNIDTQGGQAYFKGRIFGCSPKYKQPNFVRRRR